MKELLFSFINSSKAYKPIIMTKVWDKTSPLARASMNIIVMTWNEVSLILVC